MMANMQVAASINRLLPAQDILAIRYNSESEQLTLDALRWGLIPHWAKDPKIAYKTINARVETVDMWFWLRRPRLTLHECTALIVSALCALLFAPFWDQCRRQQCRASPGNAHGA
jgi:hypothetical protein